MSDPNSNSQNSEPNNSAPVKPGPTSSDRPWPVRELAEQVKGWINRLGTVWIEGEITQWGLHAGNVYGKLKDLEQDVTISFNIWNSTRAKFTEEFAAGDRVIARVKPDYWLKGGTLGYQVSELRKSGLGDLLERVERLRRSLAEEGLFDPALKKPLPFLPKLIGLITGKDSDAEKDVLRNSQLRWPEVRFRTAYASVQGERTVAEVLAALELLDSDPEVEVIIIARGGGDFQNLLGFSDEKLVRAVAAAKTPVVSAIGHEADRPILDDVADLRASTPTDAAKRVVPDITEELGKIQQARVTSWGILQRLIHTEIDRIEQIRSRPVLLTSDWIIDERADELGRLKDQSSNLISRTVERAESSLRELSSSLRSLSPQSTLNRGYAIVQTLSGQAVRTSSELKESDEVLLSFAQGKAEAKISRIAE